MMVYRLTFAGKRIVHAVLPRHSTMGNFHFDQLFGGGLYVLCGLPAEGDAVISPTPGRESRITCKRCIRVISAVHD